jgi:syntaxin-binding protein 5
MFKSSKGPVLPPGTDFTKNLKEISFYRYGHLRSLGLTGDVTALAVDPILSLFAVGTTSGNVHVYGQPAFQFTLPISGASSAAPASPIKFLVFHPGHHRIVAVDESNTIHSFSLQHITDQPNPSTHPPLPTREGAYSMYGTVTAVDQPLPSTTHMFFSMKDGATLAWDLSRHCIGALKIGNCWVEYEERMVRSGIPGRRRTLGG